MSATVVCVLRAGRDFAPRHVQWLAAQVPGLVCLSDQAVPGVRTIALRSSWPGWWAKLEAFDPELVPGDVLLMDLDTVVLELPALPSRTTVLRDFYRPQLMQTIAQAGLNKPHGFLLRIMRIPVNFTESIELLQKHAL